jgi:hypothetical protein
VSMRYTSPIISRPMIEQFLQTLSQLSPQYGRLYLAGDAALVRLGVRPGLTRDIEIVVDASDEGQMSLALQRCTQFLHINVQLTSPEDHVPVPWNWDNHARYISTYGPLEVFYFDLPSVALSKIVLSNPHNLHDVQLLIQQKIITLHELDDTYLDVQPRMGKRPYEQLDPQKFAIHYAQTRKWLASAIQAEAASHQ